MTASTQASWSSGPDGWTLRLHGAGLQVGAGLIPALPAGATAVVVDGQALQGWDDSLAVALWVLAGEVAAQGGVLDTQRLPAGLQNHLVLVAPGLSSGALPSSVPVPSGAQCASRAPHSSEAAVTVAFLGEVLLALARLTRSRSQLLLADVIRQLDQTGPRSLPIVVLTCSLVGLMLVYMGGAQLDKIGAESFVARIVTVGMVRELAGLMTGIMLAGRVGSAFTAQLATMQAGEEIDALRAMGVDPVAHLVLPRLLALLVMAPALIGFGALAGVLAGFPAAHFVYGVSLSEYQNQCLLAFNFTHLWIGMFKGMLYAGLVALAGCREGLHAGRSAQAVGEATTTAVVKALVWIVCAACLTTVVFTTLGY